MPDSRKLIIATLIEAALKEGGFETLGVIDVYEMGEVAGYGCTIVFPDEDCSVAINVVEGPDLVGLGIKTPEGKIK